MTQRMTLILVLLLFSPCVSDAAYLDQAKVLRYEQDSNGAARLIMRFTGDAGEPIVDRAYQITGASTMTALRNWINAVAAELNLSRLAGTAPQVAAETVINGLVPAVVTPSAKSVWRSKNQVFGLACKNGFTGTVATACTALQADIQSTYQAGFLDAN